MPTVTPPAAPPSDEFVQDALRQLLAARGLDCHDYNGWLLQGNRPPGLQARWTPSSRHPELMGALAVTVRMADRREITESFAGIGPGEAGVRNALASFAEGALPVLLSVLWPEVAAQSAQPITPAIWNVGGQLFDAFLGPWQLRNDAPLPPQLDDLIRAKVEAEPLTQDLHWFRLFISQAGGRLIVESLHDNTFWENGQSVADRPWPEREGFYSARQFLMVRRKTT